jgi:hypothetical protein
LQLPVSNLDSEAHLSTVLTVYYGGLCGALREAQVQKTTLLVMHASAT